MEENKKEQSPQFLVFEGKSDKNSTDDLESETKILENLTEIIQNIKDDDPSKTNRAPLRKFFLITCYGNESNDYDNFTYHSENISIADIVYITEKLKFRYLLQDEIGTE